MPASAGRRSTSTRSWRREGRYDLRNYVMIASDDANLDHYLKRGPQTALYDGRVWIRAIKISADGALGSRGAALARAVHRFAGAFRASSPRRASAIEQVAVRALQAGFQLNVHAIGDRANRIVLDAFEAAFRHGADGGPSLPRRARADSALRGHPALRLARRDSLDAGEPPDERHVLGGQPARPDASAGRLRVALTSSDGGHHPERQRFSRGACESAHLVSCVRLAAGREQLAHGRLVRRAAHDARRGAQIDDALARDRLVSGEGAGLDSRPGSSRTSSCSIRTS